jgi:hypothetical protein
MCPNRRPASNLEPFRNASPCPQRCHGNLEMTYYCFCVLRCFSQHREASSQAYIQVQHEDAVLLFLPVVLKTRGFLKICNIYLSCQRAPSGFSEKVVLMHNRLLVKFVWRKSTKF